MLKLTILFLLVATLHISLARIDEGGHKVSDHKKNGQEILKALTKSIEQKHQKKVEANKHEPKKQEPNKHEPKKQEPKKHVQIPQQPKHTQNILVTKSEAKPKDVAINKHTPEIPKQTQPNSNSNQNQTTTLSIKKTNVIFAPDLTCGPGEQKDGRGTCRKIFRRKRQVVPPETNETSKEEVYPVVECVIGCHIPDRCPPGQKPDANGNCRDEWGG